jgi:phenylacetic acid degradation operon negative regulatory protein
MHHGTLEWPADPGQVVARAWDLQRLELRYADFVARTSRLREQAAALDDRAAFRASFLLTHEFRRFPFSDPDLPDVLLPAGWVGGTARELFLACHKKLRKRAERFYLDIAREATIVENSDRTK